MPNLKILLEFLEKKNTDDSSSSIKMPETVAEGTLDIVQSHSKYSWKNDKFYNENKNGLHNNFTDKIAIKDQNNVISEKQLKQQPSFDCNSRSIQNYKMPDPQVIKDLMELNDQIKNEATSSGKITLLKQMLELCNDNFGKLSSHFFEIITHMTEILNDYYENKKKLTFHDPSSAVIAELTCNILHSVIITSDRIHLINSNIISLLLNIADIYNPVMQQCFHEVLINMRKFIDQKLLVAEIKKCSSRMSKVIASKFSNVLDESSNCKTVYYVDLYNTSNPEKEINVKNEITESSFMWSYPPDYIYSDLLDVESSVEWHDVFITEVVNPFCFWMHIGYSCLTQVQEIENIIDNISETDKCISRLSKVNDILLVSSTNSVNSINSYRGKILSLEENEVTIFAIDYGFIQTVSLEESLFELPKDLLKYPPQASLCTPAGLISCPDVKVIIRVLLILKDTSYFSTFSVFKEMDKHPDWLHIIFRLCLCPIKSIKIQALAIIRNLATLDRCRLYIGESGGIKLLLDICAAELRLDPPAVCYKLLQHSIRGLQNLMYDSYENRQTFLNFNGLEILMEVQFSVQNNAVKNCIWSAIRVLFGRYITHVKPLNGLIREATNNSHKTFNKVINYISHNSLRLDNKHKLNAYKGIFRVHIDEESDDSSDEESLVLPTEFAKLANGKLDSSICVKNETDGSVLYNKNIYYIKNDVINLQNGPQVEISFATVMKQISSSDLGTTICAMLNSELGGTIYFGFSSSGLVHGVNLSRDDRDSFRLGIAQMLSRLFVPILSPTNITVNFVPILVKHENNYFVLDDLFIIKIVVDANRNMIYSFRTGFAYFRKGTENILYTMQNIRELTIELQENRLLEQIRLLQKSY